jgi:hypothetical protein
MQKEKGQQLVLTFFMARLVIPTCAEILFQQMSI